MTARVVLEPGNERCASLVRALKASPAMDPHMQRTILAIYLAGEAGDDDAIPYSLSKRPATRAEHLAVKRDLVGWARESGWYDTAKLVLTA